MATVSIDIFQPLPVLFAFILVLLLATGEVKSLLTWSPSISTYSTCLWKLDQVWFATENTSFLTLCPKNYEQEPWRSCTGIKMSNLDISVLFSIRPISKLAFFPLVWKKNVLAQLSFLITHYILEVFQSSYWTLHSSETALARVFNHIFFFFNLVTDTGDSIILVLLDLTVVFDSWTQYFFKVISVRKEFLS